MEHSDKWTFAYYFRVEQEIRILNIVYSNIHTRVDEIGMQRAIGMSAACLYKTFLWEDTYYGIFAPVFGIRCIFVGAAQTDAFQLVVVPVEAIVEVAIIFEIERSGIAVASRQAAIEMNIVDFIVAVE